MNWIKVIAGMVALAALTGCQQQPTVQEAKIEANKRWMQTRAQMQYSVAVEHLRAGQLDKAKSKAQEALALVDEYVDARLLLAKVYIEDGSYATAAVELAKVCQQRPKSAEAAYLLGVAQEKQGQLDEALSGYRRAYALDNTYLPAITAIAEVMVAKGQVREAQVHIESYMSLAGDDPAMYEVAGRLAMMQKEYDKAVKYFIQARDLDYKNLMYQEALGKAQFMAGRYADAAESLKGLTSVKDHGNPVWLRTMLGDCYMALNRPREARDEYQTATELAPAQQGNWVSLASAAILVGDTSRAVLAAQQAAQLAPDSLDGVLILGYALVRDGQADRAVKMLEEASRTRVDNPVLQCLLGRAHAAAGDEAKAVRCYNLALRLEPGNQTARELLKASTLKQYSRLD